MDSSAQWRFALLLLILSATASAQLNDVVDTPNPENEGIKKSLTQQIGAGRGDILTPDASWFIIKRDPFRAIVRGRQLFQRKFRMAHGLGPRTADGVGMIAQDGSLGAGIADSCTGCHGRPRGSAGVGGNVFTRPDSRDAPHLFGLGLVEMLADEFTTVLRQSRDYCQALAVLTQTTVTHPLKVQGISFGSITAFANGQLDVSNLQGVDADLRVKPFFAEGSSFSIREFAVGAFNAEMGLESPDTDLITSAAGGTVTTPAGLILDGAQDVMPTAPVATPTADPDGDGVVNEIPGALIDYMEFYLLNYFRPGIGRESDYTRDGQTKFAQIGCTTCHVPDLRILSDRRVADTDTRYDEEQGVFNHLFTQATPLFNVVPDGSGFSPQKLPNRNPFVVRQIYTDFRRHDLGPAFWERNFDGSITKAFMTEPLWGVGSTAPYGHDGRSMGLRDVILRHGGEAQASKVAFTNLGEDDQRKILAFLQTLVLFPPADTASNLDPGNPAHPLFPLRAHGSIDLSVLFNNPNDKE